MFTDSKAQEAQDKCDQMINEFGYKIRQLQKKIDTERDRMQVEYDRLIKEYSPIQIGDKFKNCKGEIASVTRIDVSWKSPLGSGNFEFYYLLIDDKTGHQHMVNLLAGNPRDNWTPASENDKGIAKNTVFKEIILHKQAENGWTNTYIGITATGKCIVFEMNYRRLHEDTEDRFRLFRNAKGYYEIRRLRRKEEKENPYRRRDQLVLYYGEANVIAVHDSKLEFLSDHLL